MGKIQTLKPVKESMIWSLHQKFNENRGPGAWKEDLISEGSTSNCYTADTYAAIIAAFLRDLQADGNTAKPMIIELGGGSGKFAWQFLNRLCNYQFGEEETIPEFTYMLTDPMAKCVEMWNETKRFHPLIKKGILEFGQFAIESNPSIRTPSGEIPASDLADRPVVIIANYQFDALPTDLFRIKNHEIRRVLLGLDSEEEDFLSKPLKSFESLSERFSSRKLDGQPTQHAGINRIMRRYAKLDGDFYVNVPEESFRFLESFMERETPMMMLAGDMAYAAPDEFSLDSPFVFEDYFAHYTNFDMFAELFRNKGGKVQFERQIDADFVCGAFVHPGNGQSMARLSNTMRTAAQNLREFNPYDAHELDSLLKEWTEEASYRQIFAWLRFSKFDPSVAEKCLPLIVEELQQGHEDPDEELLHDCLMEAYRGYFPDGSSPPTLDIGITQVLLAIKYDDEALELIEEGLEEFGPSPSRHYVHALALLRKRRKKDARRAIDRALAMNSEYGPAIRFIEDHFGSKTKNKADAYSHMRVSHTDPAVREKAWKIYDKLGTVLIDDMHGPGFIKELRSGYDQAVENWRIAGLGTPNNVGDKRFTVPIRIKPPFNNPALFANAVLMDLLTEAMGDKPVLSAFGAVATRKGARAQHVHREHPLLFSDDAVNVKLPCYAVNVLMPLIDLDEQAGGTQLWPQTHLTEEEYQWEGPSTVVYTKAGSALTLDYRLYHGGMPCEADHGRPLIFLSYSLPWFTDTLAFESHAAVAISKQELEAIPEKHRDMFRFAKRIAD